MNSVPTLRLGRGRSLLDPHAHGLLHMPAHHLVTHAVVTGTTGSGKTGLVTVLAEEALRAQVPVLVLDVKGDLPNLLLGLPSFDPALVLPWVEGLGGPGDTRTDVERAAALAAERERGLREAEFSEAQLAAYASGTRFRLLTPGSSTGEPLHLLSSLERRSERWDTDPEAARAALGAAISLVLRLVGRESDPARSREHVLLSVLAERRLSAREPADLPALLEDLGRPPIESVGALAVDDFMPRAERKALAAALNALLAAPSFASWRTGASLDVSRWLTPSPLDPRTPCVVLSVAHLDDEERALVLGVVLEEVLAWMRTLPGSKRLRALVIFDEVYGYLPPHPHDPPTKRPLVALLKQARAFGVGLVVATQNPMDLDYRALGNAGLWCVGRLQTDADCARVLDGLAADDGGNRSARRALEARIQSLAPRWFLVRDSHADPRLALLAPRQTFSLLRGPMTRAELVRARARLEAEVGDPAGAACPAPPA